MTTLVLTVAVVVGTSALCSLFEAVLYSVPMSRVEALVAESRPAGHILQALRRRVDEPITAILSLNTIANTAGAAVAGALAAEVLGSQWLALFSAGFTAAILIFSEVVPKTAGVVYGGRLAPYVARPLQLLTLLFTPLVRLLGLLTQLIARGTTETSVSEEEILTLARVGRTTGVIDEEEGAVIENVLRLEHIPVRDVMTPETVVFSLDGDLSVATAVKKRRISVHTRIPVFSEDPNDIVGFVSAREVLLAALNGRGETLLEDLAKPVHMIPDDMPLDRVLARFLSRHEQMFVVIDEFGGIAGVVTLEDVVEELLGKEIVDETDEVADLRELARKRRERLLRRRGVGGAPKH